MRTGIGSFFVYTCLVSILAGCVARKIKPGEYRPIPVQEQYRIFESFPEVSLVGFADTFSLSREIPEIEREWLAVLYFEREFDVLALGGSTFDVWLSMDLILNQGMSEENIRQARLRGMPIGYQTSEMETLFSWVRETRNRSEPFYVVGFGQEVASSYGWRNQFLIRTFAEVLRSYGARGSVSEIEGALSPLLKLKKCKESGFPKNEEVVAEIKKSIISLESLVSEVEGVVQEKFPGLSHAKVLRSLSAHFQSALDLCEARGLPQKRVELESGLVLRAKSEWSRSGKVVVLGDFRSLRNSKGTLGSSLKSKMGEQMFVIATLPIQGELIARTSPPKKVQIKGNETPIQEIFQNLDAPAFVPFFSLSPRAKRWAPIFQKGSLLLEGVSESVECSKEVDGLLVFPKVSHSGKWYLDHLQFKKEW